MTCEWKQLDARQLYCVAGSGVMLILTGPGEPLYSHRAPESGVMPPGWYPPTGPRGDRPPRLSDGRSASPLYGLTAEEALKATGRGSMVFVGEKARVRGIVKGMGSVREDQIGVTVHCSDATCLQSIR